MEYPSALWTDIRMHSHYAYSICVVYKKNPTKPTCKKEYNSARKNLYDGFYQILISADKPSIREFEVACGIPIETIQSYKAETLSRLISEICMDLSRELGDIPNADILCQYTGVKALYEKTLLHRRMCY